MPPVRLEVRDSLNEVLAAFSTEIGPHNSQVDYQEFAKRQLKEIRHSGEWRAYSLRFMLGERVLGSYREIP